MELILETVEELERSVSLSHDLAFALVSLSLIPDPSSALLFSEKKRKQ